MNIENTHSNFVSQWFSRENYHISREWVKDKISWILWTQSEKKYWSVTDLEHAGILKTQENWDTFKRGLLYSKFETPNIVKGVLISRKIIP